MQLLWQNVNNLRVVGLEIIWMCMHTITVLNVCSWTCMSRIKRWTRPLIKGNRQWVRQRLCRVNVVSQAWHYEFALGNCGIDCQDITQTKFKKTVHYLLTLSIDGQVPFGIKSQQIEVKCRWRWIDYADHRRRDGALWRLYSLKEGYVNYEYLEEEAQVETCIYNEKKTVVKLTAPMEMQSMRAMYSGIRRKWNVHAMIPSEIGRTQLAKHH